MIKYSLWFYNFLIHILVLSVLYSLLKALLIIFAAISPNQLNACDQRGASRQPHSNEHVILLWHSAVKALLLSQINCGDQR